MHFGVLLMIGIIVLCNSAVFAKVIYNLIRRSKSAGTNKTTTDIKADHNVAWRRVQNAVAISALLGVTWFFGFMAIGGARVLFNVLFLVFNSLQGLAIFTMFCVGQKDVREMWSRWIHCCTTSGSYAFRNESRAGSDSNTLSLDKRCTKAEITQNQYSTHATSVSDTA